MPLNVDYAKWDQIVDDEDEVSDCAPEGKTLMTDAMNRILFNEVALHEPRDKLKDLKIKMAMDAYDKRRPRDITMHHYWIKEAGDPEAIGEYFPTGDVRHGCPVYRNQHNLILSRELESAADENCEDTYGWVVGHAEHGRPLYGVKTADMSVPTLGWQTFTAPLPLPVLRYCSHLAAAKVYKERGNGLFQARDFAGAEMQYGLALGCKIDRVEHAESIALILSNRAEARLRSFRYEEAAEDCESSLKLLRTTGSSESTDLLRQKTVVRKVKALRALKQHSEAARLLKDAKMTYPHDEQIGAMWAEAQLVRRALQGKTGTAAVVRYMIRSIETLQDELSNADDLVSDLSPTLATTIKKIEHILLNAIVVEGDLLRDLQTLLRTMGGVRCLLQILHTQWKSNLHGKVVDTFKHPALRVAVSALSLACEGSVENLKHAVMEASCYVCLLGGCNRKVEADVCERLISLVAGTWEHCRSKVMEVVLQSSIVVERAADFLSRAILAEPDDDWNGPDAPHLSHDGQNNARLLLNQWLSCGTRVEKRTLRGCAANLAGPDGVGFFTSHRQVQDVGRLILQKTTEEVQILNPTVVGHLVSAVRILIISGPVFHARKEEGGTVEVKGLDGWVMRFCDLESWAESEDGRHAASILGIVGKALEYRLVLRTGELERDAFERAFVDAGGFSVLIPLVQAPTPLAVPALRCLAAVAQTSQHHVQTLIAMRTVEAVLSLPTPNGETVASHVKFTLKDSMSARCSTAKILSRCVGSDVFLELFQKSAAPCVKEMVRLIISVRNDGKRSLEAFHDLLHVFYWISQSRPGALSRHLPVDMLNILVGMSNQLMEDLTIFYAKGIIESLLRDPYCEKLLLPIINRNESSSNYDDELFDLHRGINSEMVTF